ncbi:hypothetical protein EDD27_6872 [Nonomuraea polychroma]|uniref:Adhesin n=1 Tax=Nonomuraea polychroma TaxID=46176 RepID=A0A438MEC2_9ACTN|nr:hypothetical protein [Nonomuraea polychroma]RVX44149.1 hypothetical protein EDD27_6872 [Nonomuraea polychroma]
MAEWNVDGPYEIELAGVTRAIVRIIDGDVAVVAGEGPSKLEIGRVKGAPLRVGICDGVLEIRHDLGLHRKWYRDLPPAFLRKTDLSLRLPAGTPVRVETVSGGITMAGPGTEISLATLNGEIVMEGAGPRVTAKTVSGEIIASRCHGEVQLETVSGEITMITDMEAVDAVLSSVSGAITLGLEGERDKAGLDVELSTASGKVVANPPEDGRPGPVPLPFSPAGKKAIGVMLREPCDGGSQVQVRGFTVSGKVALVVRADDKAGAGPLGTGRSDGEPLRAGAEDGA